MYKTIEQWKAENPGVADSLTWKTVLTDQVDPGGTLTQRLNERFVIERTSVRVPFLSTQRHEDKFVDVKSAETLAKRVTVTSGYRNPGLGGGPQGFKFWLSLDPCVRDIQAYGRFFRGIHQMGTKK